MSQGRHNYKNEYLHGTTVALPVDEEYIVLTPSTFDTVNAKNTWNKKRSMSAVYFVFLLAVMAFTCFVMFNYISKQSELTASSKRVALCEQQLYNLTLENDDEYSKIKKSVDLDMIRQIAINDLGMVYASEDQIIKYSREQSDYVRQLRDINN